jgi:hypothetical protein
MGKRGRRRKQLLDDLEEKRGYCKLKNEALDSIFCRARFREAMDLSHNTLQSE